MSILKKIFGPSLDELAKRQIELMKRKSAMENKTSESVKTFEEKQPEYYYMHFRVAGTTFMSGQESRQTLLQKIRYKENPFEEIYKIEIEPYIYENENAYQIKVNEKIIGNLPRKDIPEFEKYMKHPFTIFPPIIIGGDYIDGDKLKYGCEIRLKFDLSE